MAASDKDVDNRAILRKLVVVAVLMFGFGWALVPLYRKICEITGVNVVTTRGSDSVSSANTQIDASRTVIVEFDANTQGPWKLHPQVNHMKVHPGELIHVDYELTNTAARPVAGQAIPSFAPMQSASYFRKLECFCFQQQRLEANETRRFPVVFYVDAALPHDVTTITLSYTFFEVAGAVSKDQAAGSASPQI